MKQIIPGRAVAVDHDYLIAQLRAVCRERDIARAELAAHQHAHGCVPAALLAHWYATDAGRSCEGISCGECSALAEWIAAAKATQPGDDDETQPVPDGPWPRTGPSWTPRPPCPPPPLGSRT